MDIQGRADLYWPTRYENWPNASIKGIDSISPASTVQLSLCAARKDFVPALGRLTQLWEQQKENRLNYAISHGMLQACGIASCATYGMVFVYLQCHRVLLHKHQEALLYHRPALSPRVRSNPEFHQWYVAQPEKEDKLTPSNLCHVCFSHECSSYTIYWRQTWTVFPK